MSRYDALCRVHPSETPVRCDRHDAYACLLCNRWLEEPCPNEHCTYCRGRPATPSDLARDEFVVSS